MSYIKFLTLFVFFLLASPALTFAGRGYDVGGGISWDVNSGSRSCPSGKVLLEQWSNKGGLDRNNSNTNKCYRVDNTAPTMSVNLNGYTNDTWTQNNVTISVNVSDGGAGVDTVRFYVNGNLERTGTSFDYTLSEEGEYVVDTVAYDNAKYSSYDGSGLSTGNGDTVRKIIKIDTSAPVFTQDASPTTQDWSAAKPNVGFKMEDKYKGRNTVSKVFTCPVLPTNATELYPRIAGQITGYCNPNTTNCSNNANYSPNSTDCSTAYECNDGYVRNTAGQCVEESIPRTCDASILPSRVFAYDKNDHLQDTGPSDGKVSWTAPSGVSVEGNFLSVFNIPENRYLPETNSCNYTCSNGYHNEGSDCVNDVKIVCCVKRPLAEIRDQGVQVDCSDPANAARPECEYNQLCEDYVKDVLGEWSYGQDEWVYTDSSNTMYTRVDHACNYEDLAHSNGFTCDRGYYLVNANTGNETCEPVPVGEWSGQENEKHACTNKPSNSVYTSGGTNNNCEYSCSGGFKKSGNRCNLIVNGSCGAAEDNSYPVYTDITEAEGCSAGTFNWGGADADGDWQGADDGYANWSCDGSFGGTDVDCRAEIRNGTIDVISANYGFNCPANDGVDITSQTQAACNGTSECDFSPYVDFHVDPCDGWTKDVQVVYTCQGITHVHSIFDYYQPGVGNTYHKLVCTYDYDDFPYPTHTGENIWVCRDKSGSDCLESTHWSDTKTDTQNAVAHGIATEWCRDRGEGYEWGMITEEAFSSDGGLMYRFDTSGNWVMENPPSYMFISNIRCYK